MLGNLLSIISPPKYDGEAYELNMRITKSQVANLRTNTYTKFNEKKKELISCLERVNPYNENVKLNKKIDTLLENILEIEIRSQIFVYLFEALDYISLNKLPGDTCTNNLLNRMHVILFISPTLADEIPTIIEVSKQLCLRYRRHLQSKDYASKCNEDLVILMEKPISDLVYKKGNYKKMVLKQIMKREDNKREDDNQEDNVEVERETSIYPSLDNYDFPSVPISQTTSQSTSPLTIRSDEANYSTSPDVKEEEYEKNVITVEEEKIPSLIVSRKRPLETEIPSVHEISIPPPPSGNPPNQHSLEEAMVIQKPKLPFLVDINSADSAKVLKIVEKKTSSSATKILPPPYIKKRDRERIENNLPEPVIEETYLISSKADVSSPIISDKGLVHVKDSNLIENNIRSTSYLPDAIVGSIFNSFPSLGGYFFESNKNKNDDTTTTSMMKTDNQIEASEGESKGNEAFEKYEKMFSMLPEGAVRQKMKNDGVCDAEIDKFFNSSENNNSSNKSRQPLMPSLVAPPHNSPSINLQVEKKANSRPSFLELIESKKEGHGLKKLEKQEEKTLTKMELRPASSPSTGETSSVLVTSSIPKSGGLLGAIIGFKQDNLKSAIVDKGETSSVIATSSIPKGGGLLGAIRGFKKDNLKPAIVADPAQQRRTSMETGKVSMINNPMLSKLEGLRKNVAPKEDDSDGESDWD